MLFSRLMLTLLGVVWLSGCQSMYYGAMEKVGVHKRDIMIDRVEAVQDAQGDAKEQFASALERYQALIDIEDSELEDRYEDLNDEFEDSEAAAQRVSDRVNAVEDVSEALFDEWEDELKLYTNQSLRRDSAQRLQQTRQKYSTLIKAMRAAEARMEPVLNTMRDQVLYLKHNLNARAIDSLRGELSSIESQVTRLIAEMEKSIAESDAFIDGLKEAR